MSVLDHYFNKKVNQSSPVQEDFDRVVNYDEDGCEKVTWKKVDYPSVQAKMGSVLDWSLNALLSAGINPNFPIHTGNVTRLDGLNQVEKASAYADSLLAENSEIASETPAEN